MWRGGVGGGVWGNVADLISVVLMRGGPDAGDRQWEGSWLVCGAGSPPGLRLSSDGTCCGLSLHFSVVSSGCLRFSFTDTQLHMDINILQVLTNWAVPGPYLRSFLLGSKCFVMRTKGNESGGLGKTSGSIELH